MNRYIIESKHVGSRVTCNPPPTDTDDDILYLVTDVDAFATEMRLQGFYVDGSLMGGVYNTEMLAPGLFVSMKHATDIRNLIITSSDRFYTRFLAATTVATRLNLMDKQDRIALFQAVLYGNF